MFGEVFDFSSLFLKPPQVALCPVPNPQPAILFPRRSTPVRISALALPQGLIVHFTFQFFVTKRLLRDSGGGLVVILS